MSNILDSELNGRKPMKGACGQVVGSAIVDNKLLCGIVQRIKSVARIETLLVLVVAALNLAIVPWYIWFDALVTNTELLERLFKECFPIRMLRIEPVCKLWAVGLSEHT